jgi:hypothetical protein
MAKIMAKKNGRAHTTRRADSRAEALEIAAELTGDAPDRALEP